MMKNASDTQKQKGAEVSRAVSIGEYGWKRVTEWVYKKENKEGNNDRIEADKTMKVKTSMEDITMDRRLMTAKELYTWTNDKFAQLKKELKEDNLEG